jgi:DUF1009 family protein
MSTIGLIAGNGRFPFLVAAQARKAGDTVVAIALTEETDPALASHVDRIHWISVAQFQKLIDLLHEEHITAAVMAGQVKHARLFSGLKLDWRAIKLLGKLLNKKTDTILSAVCSELEKEGIRLLPSHQYLAHLLPPPGLLSGNRLSASEKADVEFGRDIAKRIAGMDIGQTVVVKEKSVVAVESIEGTNEAIKRAAAYAGDGIVVVKVGKPNQDFRFDVPVIGPETIATMAAVTARVLAIEAGITLLLDREQLLAAAERQGISVVAFPAS